MRLLTILAAIVAATLIVPFCASGVDKKQNTTPPMDTLQAKALRLRVETECRVKALEATVCRPMLGRIVPISASEAIHWCDPQY